MKGIYDTAGYLDRLSLSPTGGLAKASGRSNARGAVVGGRIAKNLSAPKPTRAGRAAAWRELGTAYGVGCCEWALRELRWSARAACVSVAVRAAWSRSGADLLGTCGLRRRHSLRAQRLMMIERETRVAGV